MFKDQLDAASFLELFLVITFNGDLFFLCTLDTLHNVTMINKSFERTPFPLLSFYKSILMWFKKQYRLLSKLQAIEKSTNSESVSSLSWSIAPQFTPISSPKVTALTGWHVFLKISYTHTHAHTEVT